ncbi:restriction endonuclease [Pseudomonas syringae ICMP 11168]|uniref:restriction endonuclease subunit S n=1 Tax=Pseudomonas syringae group TaxID=136849 RepID=UPI00073128B2|nr:MULTISPECIES: restriction endonuclease subunit S [Pseudomonas syringae group]KTC09048.1 restriction endonuclease [Pseudomonas syringae ICMP 11168]
MTALLTDNMPLLAGAPNGIKKLRELILELAVRGKLVPQNPGDESASELLKRIAEKKSRLVAEGKIKKQKALPKVSEEEEFFDLPLGWSWCRLQDAFDVRDGTHDTPKYQPSGYPLVTSKNLYTGKLDLTDVKFISEEDHHKISARSKVDRGDILFAMIGSIGNPVIVDTDVPFSIKNVALVKPYAPEQISTDFLLLYLLVAAADMREKSAGGVQSFVSLGSIRLYPFAFPSLSEQHRIVAKVDELMTLCERMEAQQADAGSAHAQLVQALLDSLTQARDATEFAANWQRLAEHFHTLFTTESSIDAFKRTLLHLGVMGKLAPQDPNDEPASELLKRIAEEKAELVKSKTIKVSPSLDAVAEREKLFDIPTSWEWVRIGEICRPVSSGSTPSPELFRYEDGVPFLKVYNIRNQEIDFDYKRQFVSPEYHSSKMKRSTLIPGDVVMNIVGPPLGKVAIIPNTFPEWNCNQAIVFFGLIGTMLPQYVFTFLKDGSFLRNIALIGTAGQDNISVTKSKNIAIPIPPFAEQHRIVAKIDQLMVLCDQLKTRLTQARQLNEKLASTLVERALAENGQQAPTSTDRQVARTLLAAEITHQLHSQRTFGQRKLQKVIYLAEHTARLAAIQGNYLRDAAGPHDRQLMNKVEGEMQTHQWYERIERETIGHAYRPLSQAGQHRQAYSSAWSVAERATIEQVIELMRDWDTDHCEMTVTLYAAWNDCILEGRPVSDDAIVDEVMHSWNDTKLRFGKTEWLAILAEMKKHKILIPTGFGKRTTGGMLSLPGFE